METQNLIENATIKLKKKNCDMIVANNLRVEGAGFAGDTNVATLIHQDHMETLDKMSKYELGKDPADSFRKTKTERTSLMLIVIDIGNTNITIGIYKDDKLIGNYRLTTKMKRTSDEYGFMILNFLSASKASADDIKDVIISSVVPKIMHSFLNGIRKYMHKEPIVVGPGIRTGISVKAENPKAVGADRIVDAAGAYYEYGGPCLVVDFGTATTYDYVDANGNFEFGVIALGIETSAQAMWTQAAKLPEIEIKNRRRS